MSIVQNNIREDEVVQKQMLMSMSVVLLFASLTPVLAGVYKEGKIVSDRKSQVDVVKMQWGKLDESQDRLIGTIRVFDKRVIQMPYNYRFTISFDYSDKKAQNVGSETLSFTFKEYGHKTRGTYVEGEFCVEFQRNDAAVKAAMVNVQIDGLPVKYQTKFNISASLMRSGFAPREPKVIPVR